MQRKLCIYKMLFSSDILKEANFQVNWSKLWIINRLKRKVDWRMKENWDISNWQRTASEPSAKIGSNCCCKSYWRFIHGKIKGKVELMFIQKRKIIKRKNGRRNEKLMHKMTTHNFRKRLQRFSYMKRGELYSRWTLQGRAALWLLKSWNKRLILSTSFRWLSNKET